MRRRLTAVGVVAATVAGIATYAITGEVLGSLALLCVALAVWTLSSVTGRPRGKRVPIEQVDPAAVKEYRRAHPGTSIVDAARAVGQQSR